MKKAGHCFVSVFAVIFLSSIASAHPRPEDRAAGARPLALGGAFVGVADDANAVFYNPAGLALLSSGQTQATFGKPTLRNSAGPSRNVSLGSLAFVDADPKSPAVLGFSWSHLTDVDVRRENRLAVSGAYRIALPDPRQKLSFGVSAKYLESAVLNAPVENRAVFSGDLGLLYRPFRSFQFGTVVRDVNRPRYPVEGGDKLPAGLDVGAALLGQRGTVLALQAANAQDSGLAEFRWGLEQGFWGRALSLRVGGGSGRVSLGMGVQARVAPGADLGLDYGFSYPTDLTKDDRLHLVSLRFAWGGPVQPAGPTWTASALVDSTVPVIIPALAEKDPQDSRRLQAPLRPQGLFALGPDDILQINIKNHPELSTGCVVDSWGMIRLPFVGEIKAEGMTRENLEKQLEEIYSTMMVGPEVEVLVRENRSRYVYVMGAVNKPGKYYMQDRLVTIRDIIVEANLLSDVSAAWRAFIVRQTERGPIYIHVNLYKILYRGQFENNIALQPGDIVHVPMGILDTIAGWIGRILGPTVGIGRTLITGN